MRNKKCKACFFVLSACIVFQSTAVSASADVEGLIESASYPEGSIVRRIIYRQSRLRMKRQVRMKPGQSWILQKIYPGKIVSQMI